MLTLSNHEVGRTLRTIVDASYPDCGGQIRRFDIEILAKESRTKHGDYTLQTGAIRIFNLSRPTAHIVKTTIHELAHHVDMCFNGTTNHKRPFYEHYKHLIETAHRLGIINLADVFDDITARDMDAMAKMIGAPSFEPQAPKSGYLFKVSSFTHKDALKANGFRYSPTERVWILQVSEDERPAREAEVTALAPGADFKIVPLSENQIESIYFAVIGKDFAGTNDDARANGFRWHDKRGWYKRIKASEIEGVKSVCQDAFQVEPKFLGTL